MINKLNRKVFQQNGFIVIRSFFNKNLINKILNEVDEIAKKKIKLLDKKDFVIENSKIKYLKHVNIFSRSVNRLINTKIFNVVEELLNDKIFFDNIELHIKNKGTSETPPHQDNFYFCFKPASAVTVYTALNLQGPMNGGLSVVSGSHKKRTRDHYLSKIKAFSSGIKLNDKDKKKIINYNLNPGDIAIHHCNLIHFANKNINGTSRKALSLRFIGKKSKINKIMRKRYLKNLSKNRNLK